MNEPLQGNFDGIGIQFNIAEDTLFVIQPVSGGPSEKVGIRAGDRIIMVNDTLIAGVKMTTDDITRRLKGPKGTKVDVKVVRRGVDEGLNDKVTVSQTGCVGYCQLEPIVEIHEAGKEKVTYIHMTADKAREVVEKHLKGGKVISEYTVSDDN